MTAAKVSRPKPDRKDCYILSKHGDIPERMALILEIYTGPVAAQRVECLLGVQSRGLEAELHVRSFHELHWLETACA